MHIGGIKKKKKKKKEEEKKKEKNNTSIVIKSEEVFRTPFSFIISPYSSNTTLTICRLWLGKKLYIIQIDSFYLNQIDCQVFTSSTTNPAFKSLYQLENFKKKHTYKISDNHLQKLLEEKDKCNN